MVTMIKNIKLSMIVALILFTACSFRQNSNKEEYNSKIKLTEEYLLKRAIEFHQACIDEDDKKVISFYDNDLFDSKFTKDDWLAEMNKKRTFSEKLWNKINIFKKRIKAEDDATFKILEFSENKATIQICSELNEKYLGFSTYLQYWIFKNNDWFIEKAGVKPIK